MSVKACVGSMMLGAAVGMAVATAFPIQCASKSMRKLRRYVRNML